MQTLSAGFGAATEFISGTCVTGLSPASVSVPVSGSGSQSPIIVNVTTGPNCSWSLPTCSSGWISVVPNSSQSFGLVIPANPGGQRTANLSVSGFGLSVTQAAGPNRFVFSTGVNSLDQPLTGRARDEHYELVGYAPEPGSAEATPPPVAVPLGPTAPSVLGLTPQTLTSANQVFTLKAQQGSQPVYRVLLLFNTAITGTDGCQVIKRQTPDTPGAGHSRSDPTLVCDCRARA